MKRHPMMVTFVLLIALVMITWIAVRHRKDNARRVQSEHAYEAKVAYYSAILTPGMAREAVHDYLHNHDIVYRVRRIGTVQDDLIGIAREPSPAWYCSWLDVSVQIEYQPALGNTAEPGADDRIRDVKLDRQLQDCM